MFSFQSLKKIWPCAPSIGDTPIHLRFTDALIKHWTPLVTSLARKYYVPDRLPVEDLRQELMCHVWRITERVDPITKPDDFARLCRAELRNKCIDLNRHMKARKRMGRTGNAIQCQICGSVTRLSLNAARECNFCHESVNLRDVETYAKNVSISFETADDHDSMVDHSYEDPLDSMISDEFISRVRHAIEDIDRMVYDMLVSPSLEFLAFLRKSGHDSDHRNAANRYYSAYLGITERQVSDAHVRIKLAIKHIAEVGVGEINKVSLRRLDLA